MLRPAFFSIALLAVLSRLAAADAATAERERFCGLVRSCGMPEPVGWCDSVTKGRGYKADRCAEAEHLVARGIQTDTPLGYRLYQFLGHRYQVVYAAAGEVPLSPGRFAYLMDDLPLAAKLLSHFQPTRYTAEYVDAERRRFKGTRGGGLTTDAELVSGSPTEGRLFYFGYGVSRIGLWTLKGLALIQLDVAPARHGRALAYKVRVVSSPGNAVVDAIMKLPLFRSLVRKHIRETLTDVTQAAQKLERSGLPADASWTPDERDKLDAFLRLP